MFLSSVLKGWLLMWSLILRSHTEMDAALRAETRSKAKFSIVYQHSTHSLCIGLYTVKCFWRELVYMTQCLSGSEIRSDLLLCHENISWGQDLHNYRRLPHEGIQAQERLFYVYCTRPYLLFWAKVYILSAHAESALLMRECIILQLIIYSRSIDKRDHATLGRVWNTRQIEGVRYKVWISATVGEQL